MKRTIRLIAYSTAFVYVMPQIIVALNAGNMRLTILWYAVFISLVEGTVAIFTIIAKKETLHDIQLAMLQKDIRD